MFSVYVGIIVQIIDNEIWSLSSLVFLFTVGSFLIAAIFHPQEWTGLLCCIIYVTTIPSMYLLLTTFAIFNMNDVSWGTREVPKTETQKKKEAENTEAEKKGREKKGFIESKFLTSFSQKSEIIEMKNSLDRIEKGYDLLTNQKKQNENEDRQGESKNKLLEIGLVDGNEEGPEQSNTTDKKAGEVVNDDEYWSLDSDLHCKRCEILTNLKGYQDGKIKKKYLDDKEKEFWKALIENYLKPIDQDEHREKNLKNDLKRLKNNCALSYVIFNALWVTIILMLPSYTGIVEFKWPLSVGFDTVNLDQRIKFLLDHEYMRLEPTTLFFFIVFIFFILLQSCGMFFHAIETVEQIVSHVSITEKYYNNPLEVMEKIREKCKLENGAEYMNLSMQEKIKQYYEMNK